MKDNKPPMLAVDEFISNFNTKEFTLNKSYRSTREIMEYSNKFLKAQSIVPLVRSGDSVVEVEAQNNEELSKLIETYVDTMKNKELENVAIITRDLEDAYKIKSIISNNVSAKVIDRENVVHRDSLIIIPSYFAKGLEFDGVVVVNTGKQELITEDKLMYVMCTRALHNLFVIKTSELVDQ